MSVDPVYEHELEVRRRSARRGRWMGLALSLLAVVAATWPALSTPIEYRRTCPLVLVWGLAFVGAGIAVVAWFSRPHWRAMTWSKPGNLVAHGVAVVSLLSAAGAVVVLHDVSCASGVECGSMTYVVRLGPTTPGGRDSTTVRICDYLGCAEVVGPDSEVVELTTIGEHWTSYGTRREDRFDGEIEVRLSVTAGSEDELTRVLLVPATFERADVPRCNRDTWEGRAEIDLANSTP